MNSTLAPVADKLGKLIRLLASDRDGEVLAAVRAIGRTLGGAGSNFHALADSIEQPNGKKFSEQEALEIYQRGVENGRAQAEAKQSFQDVGDDGPSWHAVAVECAAHSDRLRPREKEFVEDMVRRTVHGGRLTERQANWLRDIYARIRR